MSLIVTIGVCAKNAENTVKDAIQSIIDQQYQTGLIQLIVVDGFSSDKTMSIVNNLTSNVGLKVETFSDKGSGLGVARQIVVNKAKGKYLIFADADVQLFCDFVGNHVKFMEENPRVGVAFGKPMFQRGTIFSSIWNLYQYSTGGFSGNDATIYRLEVLRKVGGFDPNIKGAGEDNDILRRIQGEGWSVSINERAKFFHKNRRNLKDFLAERSWFGYGGHYFSHKTNTSPSWRDNPFGAFKYGLNTAFKVYRKTHTMISFLIPAPVVLSNLSWWSGYYKAHVDGYGHRLSAVRPEIEN